MRDARFFASSLIALLLVGTPATGLAAPSEDEPAVHPLSAFEPLIGGRWQLGSSFQELEWGVGRQSVKARGFFVVDGEPRLVSEGMWFWHPGEKSIKGVFTAVGMPFSVLDYTTRFEGEKMVSDVEAYATDGSETAYVEIWELTDPEHFVWKLLRKTSEGLREEMGGTYSKQVSTAPASDNSSDG